ncbi:MAG: glycosyltransferase family 39 protein [bacterium]
MNRSVERILVTLAASAVVAGLVLRLHGLDRKVWWPDEIATWSELAGCTERDLWTFHDGRPHTVAERMRCQRSHAAVNALDVARALVDQEPQNQPLYYVTAHAALRALDGWPWAPRLVSAIASSLALAVAFFLGAELFGSWRAGAITAALVAVSPLHVRFAQEARVYSCWSLFTAASGWLLVRAYRRDRRREWWLYAAAQALACQSQLLSIPVALGQLAWGKIVSATPGENLDPRCWRRHVVAVAAALATLLPWSIGVALHRDVAVRTLDWTAEPMPLANLVRRWLGIVTTIFVRTGADGGLLGAGTDLATETARLVLGLAICVPVALAFARLVRARPLREWGFVVALGAPAFLALAIPDVLVGGRRSSMARYLLPAWWAVELVVAWAFARALQPRAHSSGVPRAALASFATLIAAGTWVCVRGAALDVWWDTNPEVLHALAAEAAPERSLAVDGVAALPERPGYVLRDVPPYQVLAFARMLDPTTVLVVDGPPRAIPPDCVALSLFLVDLRAPSTQTYRCPAGAIEGSERAG